MALAVERPTRPHTISLWLAAAMAAALATVAIWIRVTAAAALRAPLPPSEAADLADLLAFVLRLQVGLGTAAALAGAAVLAFERRVATPRGLLRVLGIVAILVAGMLALSITAPLGDTVVRGLADGPVAGDAALARRWTWWLGVHVVLALVTLATFVVAPALRRIPAAAPILTTAERRLLLVVGSATYFEGYDRFIVALALPYIGRDIGADEGTLGWALFWIRCGALLSLPLAARADRHGRRRILLLTVVGYTLATFATAFTTTTATFVACQFLATVFLLAELSLAHVVIAEEFPAEARAFGLGVIGAFGSLGAGAAAMLFPLMQMLPLGWRGLYLLGIIPLAFITILRRSLPETRRWSSLKASGAPRAGWTLLARPPYGRPLGVLIAVALVTTAAIAPAFSFFSYTATTRHAWTPAQVSMAILVGGGIGILGWPIGGRIADRFGRRLTAAIGLTGVGVAIVLLYRGPTTWLAPAFSLLVFAEAWVTTVLNALATELFPTAVRSAAKAVITTATIVGAMLGLAAVGALSGAAGGAGDVIAGLSLVNALALLFGLTVRETAGTDLDALER